MIALTKKRDCGAAQEADWGQTGHQIEAPDAYKNDELPNLNVVDLAGVRLADDQFAADRHYPTLPHQCFWSE
jgi:hypothetical protein